MANESRTGSDDPTASGSDEFSIIGRVDALRLEIVEHDLESAYRASRSDEHRAQLMIGLGVVSLPVLGFSFTDARLFGMSAPFFALLALRAAVAAFALLLIIGIRRGARFEIVDRGVLAWWILFAMCITAIDATRPPEYVLHVAIDVLTVLTAYLLPNRYRYQLASGLAITIGCVSVLLTRKMGLRPIHIFTIATAYTYATALGILLARGHHERERGRFLLDERVRRNKSELRALRRLVPMCAGCKSIKDSNGAWHKVEEFVSTETGSDVTHSLCPDCIRRLYPGVAERVLTRRPN